VPPLFTKFLIDQVLLRNNVRYLNILLAGIVAIFFFDLILGFVNHYIFVRVEQKISYDVRNDFFRRMQNLQLKDYDSKRGGNLIYRLLGDTEAIPHAVSTMIVDIVLYVLTIAVVSVILFGINWKLTVISFLIVPLHIVLILAFRKPILVYSHKLREKNETISGNIIEYFANIRLVKTFAAERIELQRFNDDQREKMQLGLKSNLINKVSNLATGSINNLLFFVILWFGGHQVIKGAISLGDLMAFLSLVGRLYFPIAGITGFILTVQDLRVGMKRAYEIYDLSPAREETASEMSDDTSGPHISGNIEFVHVNFSYDDTTPVLKNVSFRINAGERVSLVGRSGVGKSTVVNLLARFYDPQAGKILIDGLDITSLSLGSLRQNIGIVLQDPYFFSGTVRDSILYGRPFATDADMKEAAKDANAHEFILSLPQGYDTQIGERGIRLSGGQKQRIAIARTFLRNPRILILDEAMSSLDLESELLIQESLKTLMVGRTSIIIAHRWSTIKNSDKILVLHDGIIAEQGAHQDLINHKGLYYQIHEKLSVVNG
jgi:subfamily B ATP-binding cassette protein MsbA